MDRLRYDLRVLNWRILAPPIAIALGCASITIGIRALTSHGGISVLSSMLTACIEMLLPLSAGIGAATLPSQDASIELQLSLPTSFGATILRRFSVLLLWTGLIAWLVATCIFALHLWRVPAQIQSWPVVSRYLAEQLVWLAPLLWLSAVGLCLALSVRSPVASSAALGGIWILETFGAIWFTASWLHPLFLFPTTFAPFIVFWFANRLDIAGIGLALIPLCWLLLRDLEPLLRSAVAEQAS